MKRVDKSGISGTELKDAIYSALEVVGNTAREVFMEDLERTGMRFENDKTYSFTEIERVLRDTFGGEGASLIVDRIRKYLQI